MAAKRGAGEGTFWKRNGRWYGKRRVGPREATVTINASGATRTEAAENLRTKVEQFQRNAEAPIDAGATLAVYLAWWVDVEQAQRVADGLIVETTRRQYVDRVRFQITPHLGKVRLADLNAMRIRQWMARLDQQGASPSLRQHALAVLKNALEYAVRYEVLPGNPAKLVEPPAVHRQRPDEITPDIARRLLAAAQGDDLEAAYLLALHIPLRVGEVVGCEWDCFDLARPGSRCGRTSSVSMAAGICTPPRPTVPARCRCPDGSWPR